VPQIIKLLLFYADYYQNNTAMSALLENVLETILIWKMSYVPTK